MSMIYCDKANIVIEKAAPGYDRSGGQGNTKAFPRWNITVISKRPPGAPLKKMSQDVMHQASCGDLWNVVNDKCCNIETCDAKTMDNVKNIIDQSFKFDEELENADGCEMPLKIKDFTFRDVGEIVGKSGKSPEDLIGMNSLKDKKSYIDKCLVAVTSSIMKNNFTLKEKCFEAGYPCSVSDIMNFSEVERSDDEFESIDDTCKDTKIKEVHDLPEYLDTVDMSDVNLEDE